MAALPVDGELYPGVRKVVRIMVSRIRMTASAATFRQPRSRLADCRDCINHLDGQQQNGEHLRLRGERQQIVLGGETVGI
jgi:hypothetical protein